jgi:hypothetical protein
MLLDEFTMIPLTFDLLDENFEKFQKMMNFIHEKKINCRELNKFQLEKKNGQQKNSQQSLRILMLQWYRTLTKMYAQLFQRFFPKRHETTLDMTNTIKIFQKEKELQKMLGIFRDSFRLLNTPQERW